MDTKEQASQPALQTLKEYAVITAAVLIMDIGIYVFKFPNNFSFGGVSGMAVVICRFLPFTASQINLFYSTCCFCWLVLLCWGGTSASRQPT